MATGRRQNQSVIRVDNTDGVVHCPQTHRLDCETPCLADKTLVPIGAATYEVYW